MSDRIGQKVGNYRLIGPLGEGGFAKVYLGEHIYLKTQAAIKVMHTKLANKGEEGFLKEARIIAGLKHPNIVRILEFGVENNAPFFVMDYAPHGSLRDRYPRGQQIPLSTVVSYLG